MNMQRYNRNADDLTPQSFSNMLDRFFNDSVNNRSRVATFTPSVDVSETEQAFEVEVALPGLKKEEISIDFQDGKLTIAGERKFHHEQHEKKYHVVETQYGSFSRSFFLPETINPENIEATFEDGVLHVFVPKDEKRVRRQQIRIKGADEKAEARPAAESAKAKTVKEKPKAEGKK